LIQPSIYHETPRQGRTGWPLCGNGLVFDEAYGLSPNGVRERACTLLSALSLSEGVPPPRSRRRLRQPSLARLIAKAKQLGVDVTIEPNGAVTFRCSSAAPDAVINEWDEVLPRHGTH
jgi:hypothetical protein